MSFSEDELKLKKILNNIINSTPGLKYAIIVDDTGITILSQSKFTFSDDNGVSVEKIGAIGGAVFIAGEEQGHILGYGNISLQITEYFEGMIFSMKVGRGVLCISTDKKVQIGFIIATMKKWAPKITEILDRYLQAEQGEMSKEMKELFRSDSIGLL
ncbi:MAG: roadblock/LC7 domain-containing protein [Candidatus Heimdallarchaeota archaeon]